jgi:magnesium-transporting ATPase (P-type)
LELINRARFYLKVREVVAMRTIKGIFIGIIFGLILSLFSTFLFCSIAQTLAGGTSTFWGGLYLATIVPFIITFSILGYCLSKQPKVKNRKMWIISLLSALSISIYTGTIGALFGEYIERGGLRTYFDGGYNSVNVEGLLS